MAGSLTAESVVRHFGDTVAVDGVSLSVGRGEVFGLVGPNGAGKTTLVRTLVGTLRPSSGRVRLLGEDPTTVDESRIGYLPQAFRPHDRLTARELLDYYAGLYRDHRDPEAVLAEVGLEGTGDTYYENLSGGQQRRTCVGITLINDPEVLFLDEPTTGIDPEGRRTVWDLVADLSAAGVTVFLTTHYMVEAERLADRVGLLADGRLVDTGPPGELIDRYGGERQLVVETASPADADALSPLPYDVEERDTELVVHDVGPAGVGGVITRLEEAGVDYTEVTWSQPDLEDVYLRLAGNGSSKADATAETPAEVHG